MILEDEKMTIKNMVKEIATAQDTMMSIENLDTGKALKTIVKQIEKAYDVMFPIQ